MILRQVRQLVRQSDPLSVRHRALCLGEKRSLDHSGIRLRPHLESFAAPFLSLGITENHGFLVCRDVTRVSRGVCGHQAGIVFIEEFRL
jgi:hypothetical protein